MNKVDLPLVSLAMQRVFARHPCGTCQACCHVLAVKDLGKPYYTTCKDQCQSGCGIYRDRPTDCRDFECGWRCGLTEGTEISGRPDIQGILISAEENEDGLWLEAYEVNPGAMGPVNVDTLLRIGNRIGTKGVRIHFLQDNEIGCRFAISDDYAHKKHLGVKIRNYKTTDGVVLVFCKEEDLPDE